MCGRLAGPTTPPIASPFVSREDARPRLGAARGCHINLSRLAVTRYLVIAVSGRYRYHPGVPSRVADGLLGGLAVRISAAIVAAAILGDTISATIIPAAIIPATVLGTGSASVSSGGHHDHARLIEALDRLFEERTILREAQAHIDDSNLVGANP